MALALSALAPLVASAAEHSLSYSGRLVDTQGAPLAGSVDLSFQFFREADGGSGLLVQPVAKNGIELSSGVFQVVVELIDNQLDTLFGQSDDQIWIEVSVKDAAGQYRSLPRQRLLDTPFALRARSVPVDGTTIQFDAMGRLTVVSNTNDPVAGAVQSVAGKTGAITLVANDISSGEFATERIANGAITGAKIADETITNLDLANSAVTSSKIAENTITSADLAPGAVGSAALADGAVTSPKLAAGSIGAT